MRFPLDFKDNSTHAVTFGIPDTYDDGDGREKILLTIHFITESVAKKPENLEVKSLKELRYWLRIIAKGYRHPGSKMLKREIEIIPYAPGVWRAVFTYKNKYM